MNARTDDREMPGAPTATRRARAWPALPNALQSLYVRLALVLAGLFVFLGVIFFVILVRLSAVYREEVTQRTNADLAAVIARENRTIDGATIDLPGLTALLPYVMKVNPAAEVYVLDPAGRVLAYSNPGALQTRSIDLAPIRAFLDQTQRLPIRGVNPRDLAHPCVFSVAPLGDAAQPTGYVYALLSTAGAGELGRSTVGYAALAAFATSLLFALAAGLLLFRSLTGRLRRLADDVDRFRNDPTAAHVPASGADGGDEIARLQDAFAHLARRLAEQLEALARIDRDRRTALAHASHDLRTPLAALQGYLQTVAVKSEQLSDAQRAHYLAVALRHAERLGRLVEQVFALSKLDDPEAAPQREHFSLGELAGDIATKHRLRADSAGVELQIEIDAAAALVHADIAMMERLIENLIDNALKFTPAGGRVRVSLLGRTDGAIELRVSDTGCGIAPAELPHVFERFYRGTQRSRRGERDGSSGLGLAIVRRVAELHGARIDVASSPQGTCVSIVMTAAPQQRPAPAV